MDIIEIFTDGACRGNPGPGGWAALLRCRNQEKEIYGGELTTTNNRMELLAAINGLSALQKNCSVKLMTDSQYLRKGITEWIAGWKKNQWRTAAKQAVKNQDLWERLDVLAAQHQIEWLWVKGHSGHPENERVDALANKAIDELLRGIEK